MLCVDDRETGHGRFLKFETVTLCYIDTSLIDVSLLEERQLQWLNDYHETVYKLLSGHLDQDVRKWLRMKTAPLK